MTTALRHAARSDVGLVRSNNQDSAYAGPHLLVVADGMGGHAGGDVASSIAVAELSGLDDDAHGTAAPQHLLEAIHRAGRQLADRVAAEPALAGMGTTVTALLRSDDRLVLAHIGDSRAYLLRDGRLTQVTHDHTFVQHLVDEGRITPEEAEYHPQRSVLLRVLGDVGSSEEVDTSLYEARPGDRWLLCSDGLSGMVSDATLGQVLTGVPEVGECADLLVQLALRSGGSDNVTVVVADVVDDGDLPDDRAAVAGHVETVGAVEVAGNAPSAPGSEPRRPSEPHGPHGSDQDRGADGPSPPGGATGPRAGAGSDAGAHPDAEDPEDAEAPRRRRLGFRLGAAAVLVLVIAAGGFAAWRWSQQQYYVGVETDGQVAIFRGLSQDLGPWSLSSVVEQAGLTTDDLTQVPRQAVEDGIAVDDLAAARSTVASLAEDVCPAPTQAPAPTTPETPTSTSAPTPTTAGTAAGTAVPSSPTTAAPSATTSPRPTPSATATLPPICAGLG